MINLACKRNPKRRTKKVVNISSENAFPNSRLSQTTSEVTKKILSKHVGIIMRKQNNKSMMTNRRYGLKTVK